MTISMCMQFTIKTLIDITKTDATKSDNKIEWYKQQNFLTVLQTIGLRSTVLNISDPIVEHAVADNFGSYFTNMQAQKIWVTNVLVSAHSIDALHKDFDWIPMIPNLDESVVFEKCYFTTVDPVFKNIIFEQSDK